MSKALINLSKYLVVTVTFLLSGCSLFSSPCDSNALKLLAKAYALSFDYNNPTRFTSFVQSYSNEFSNKGRVTTCAIDFSDKLAGYGSGRYSSDQELNNSISSMEMQHGFTPSGRGNTGGEIILLGQEIYWLSTVFPSVAQGDFYSYNNSGTPMRKMNRNLMKTSLPLYEIFGLGDFQKNIAKNMQPLNEEDIINLGQIFYRNL